MDMRCTAMRSDGPFPLYTFIFCTADERGVTKSAAFPSDGEAIEHGRLRLMATPHLWMSVVVLVGDGDGADVEFVGAWDRGPQGALTWEAASLS